MKRFVLSLFLGAAFFLPARAFAAFHFELGVEASYLFLTDSRLLYGETQDDSADDIEEGNEGNDIVESPMPFFGAMLPIPLPALGFFWGTEGESFRFGGGIKAYTLVMASWFFPVAFAEWDVSRFTIRAQLGGGIIGIFAGVYCIIRPLVLVMPDISGWFHITEKFMLGAGFADIFISAKDDSFFSENDFALSLPLVYLGLKYRW